MIPANATNSKLDFVIERRLCGDSVANIAKDLGVSRQYIYSLFENIPRGKVKTNKIKSFSREEEVRIVKDFLRALPPDAEIKRRGLAQCEKTIVAQIAKSYKANADDIKCVLYKMTSHHPMTAQNEYYSTLYKWRMENAVSLNTLSVYAGVSVPYLREIMRGWKHLPLSAAKRIKEKTGLKISEIYGDLIRLDSRREEEPV